MSYHPSANRTAGCTPSKSKIVITAVYTSLVLLTSVIPMQGKIGRFSLEVGLTPVVQNFLHIPMFAVLTVMWLQVLNGSSIGRAAKFLAVILTALAFGAANELVQILVPGRYTGIVDLTLNLIGVILGALVFVLAERLRPGAVRRLVCG